jgi:hypothetical protein
MARREYKGAATPTTITSSITNSATTVTVADATNWPTGSFSFVIDPGLAGEEKILATSRSGTIVTITTRGYDNTSASAHTTGAVTYPVPTAIDFDEANNLVNTIGTLGTGVATFLQTPTSANLATAVTNETGSGSLVFGTSPTLSLPIIDNFILGYSTTATAAGTTTLTNASNNQQLFTGTTTQTVVMPVASTMTVGTRYLIENNSTGIVTIQSSGANTIVALGSNISVKVTCILASGTTAASWDYEYVGFNSITGTGSNVLATAPTITSPVINTATVKSPREITTVSATAATGTINFDANTQGTLYYTTSASANWTLNIRGDSGTTLNSVMATGDSLTVTFLAAQGATAYYASALTIDGTSVTPKYQGGTAWAAGNASSTDAYTYAIFKTGSAAYTVFASQTKFA